MRAGAIVAVVACGMGATIVAGTGTAAADPASASETAQARALVEQWRSAQIKGDWLTYQALYAPTFTGVRRVGKTAKRFDRAGWLADRKKMFKAAMVVEVSQVAVTAAGVTLTIELDQYWEQGVFADVGRKRMTVSLTDGLIASEELLDSTPYLAPAACTRAVFPTGKRGRTGPAKTDDVIDEVRVIAVGDPAGGRFGCTISHAPKGETNRTVEVAGLRRTAKGGWALAGTVTHDLVIDAGAGGRHDGDVTLGDLDLGATYGLIATVREREGDDMATNERSDATLYLIGDGADLDDVLTWTSVSASDAEDTRSTTCEVETRAAPGAAMHDIVRTCTKSWGDWWNEDEAERGIKTETETTRFAWDGKTYVEP